MTYSIDEDKNLSCKSYPESYREIPARKQVKITFVVQLKSFTYKLPRLVLDYETPQNQNKSIEIIMPCPLHKFVEFCPIINIK